MVTVENVRAIASMLPRSYEIVVRGRIKFRVGSLVYVAFWRDETTVGFPCRRDSRTALVESQPDKFFLPEPSDLRFHVVAAWRMCVPKGSPCGPIARGQRDCFFFAAT